MRHGISKVASEPLVQFLLLGVAVFAIDHYVFVNSDNPRRVSVDDQRFEELVDVFVNERGRAPTEDEIEELLVAWTQNEVLYREALTMGLDKGDEMIRSRMVLKLRDVVFNNVVVDLPPEQKLEAWFEAHRDAYDRPELIEFEQFPIDDLDEEGALAMMEKLADKDAPEQYANITRRYPGRLDSNLFSVFDEAGAQAMIDAPLGKWVVVRSDRGFHMARITRREPGETVTFEEARALVKSDWRGQERERQIAEAMREIVEQYDIKYEFTREFVDQTLASRQSPQKAASE